MTLNEWIKAWCEDNEVELPSDIPDNKTALQFINVNQDNGDPNNLQLIHSEELEVNYTSTSAGTIKSINLTGVNIQNMDCFLVLIRDKQGARSGYFYESINIIQPIPANDVPTLAIAKIMAKGISSFTTTATGIYINTVTVAPSEIPVATIKDLAFNVTGKYNSSSSGTIDGTYVVEIYKLSIF